MATRYTITRGMPRGGHGGASPFNVKPLKPRKRKARAARARRVRRARKVYRTRG